MNLNEKKIVKIKVPEADALSSPCTVSTEQLGSAKMQGVFSYDAPYVKKTIGLKAEGAYRSLYDHLFMVGNKTSNALLLTGDSGIGKTHNTMEVFSPLRAGIDYVVIKGHITYHRLYKNFYANNGKYIIVDDADGWINAPISISILKAVLDDKRERYVSYESSQNNEDDFPPWFIFTGQVILITNNARGAFDITAIKDRCHVMDFKLTLAQRIDFIKEIMVPMEYKNTTLEQRKYIAETIEAQAARNGVTFSFRTFTKLTDLYIQNPQNIDSHIFDIFKGNDDDKIFMEIYKKCKTTQERQKEFIAHTGTSPRHFFDVQKRLKPVIELILRTGNTQKVVEAENE